MASHAAFIFVDIFVYSKLLHIFWEVLLGLVAYHAYMSLTQTTVYGYSCVLLTCGGLGVFNLLDYLDGWGWIIYPIHEFIYIAGGLYVIKKYKEFDIAEDAYW